MKLEIDSSGRVQGEVGGRGGVLMIIGNEMISERCTRAVHLESIMWLRKGKCMRVMSTGLIVLYFLDCYIVPSAARWKRTCNYLRLYVA